VSTLEFPLVQQLGLALSEVSQSIAVAESCTGGWVAKVCTDLPGSSNWFERGFVTYSNTAKQQMLGVEEKTLENYGAVSEQVVRQMVAGALGNSCADLAVAITGIAGPRGGSSEKPVGTVWFAWQRSGGEPVSIQHLFTGNRESVRRQSVETALAGLLDLV
jgi:nicotinamide-nucleotide amidase